MNHQVRLSATFTKAFRKLQGDDQDRVRNALHELRSDPLRRRPGLDIKALRGVRPPKFRLRVGPWRVVYAIEGDVIYVYEMFQRKRGYRP